MKKMYALTSLLMISLFLTSNSPAFAADTWENINGNVTYSGAPVCAMVLANGQYMFTCSGDGSFDLYVPLDDNGQITVFAFCSGLAPYKQVIGPGEGEGMQIAMAPPEQGQGMDVSCTLEAIDTTWVRLSGYVTYNGTPVCAMVLANGQYMFTCSGDGSYSMDVPLDDMGSITLFGFCDGLPPYKEVYTTDQIDFDSDLDSDGYTIAGGDCDNLNSSIHPWAEEICGDGIDQDCDGVDQICPEDATGYWTGEWYSNYGGYGNIYCDITQSGSSVSGKLSLTNTDCGGNTSDIPLGGTAQSTDYYSFSVSTVCDGATATVEFSGQVSGNIMTGHYTTYVSGYWYDSGTFTVTKQ